MSATSPSPNSPPSSGSAPTPPPPPPPSSSSPPPTPLSPSSQPNANPPEATNTTANSPPPQPPPSPPPTAPLPPPPVAASPPPPASSPPPPPSSPNASPPLTSGSSPPPASPPPPASSTPPPNPPPPPPSEPPTTSPPPPLLNPPENSPPPPSPRAPESSPSPPATTPPRSSPSPPPPKPVSPTSSPPSPPPPPTSIAPENSPPPPPSTPPRNAPPPPRRTPPSPSDPNTTPPPANSPPDLSPSPSVIRLSPPPTSPTSPTPPSLVPISPSNNETSTSSVPSAPGSANSNGNGGIGTVGAAAIAVVASIIVLSLIGLAFWCVRKRRKKISLLSGHVMPSPMVSSSPKSDSAFLKANSTVPLIGSGSGSDFGNSPRDPAGLGNSRAWFAFEELDRATNGFSDENLLGEGGFGSVYKGYLPDGREIAVKQLKIGGGQGEREFKAEVEIISRIHHRHLVSLVGYCISDSRRLLVYDYVPNNNLYYHLHEGGRPVLDWAIRVKVAAGAARGIAYLHEDCHPRIIHRDIKSSNILLDNNFEARVSDFGLAKLALDADTHITTRVMGTFGYMAPEYASSGKLTDKSDVYSFGVVLLELITGRKPVDASQPLGDESLVEWARPLLSHAIESGEYDSLVDPKLEKNYVEAEIFRMIEISAACVRHSSTKRPRMGQVVRAFDSLGMSDLTNGMRVGESEVFNSAQQSEEIRWFRRMAFGSQDYSTDFFSQDSLRGRENRENNV